MIVNMEYDRLSKKLMSEKKKCIFEPEHEKKVLLCVLKANAKIY